MENSKKIAGLLGPALIAITLPEALNTNIFDAQIAPVVYLNGGLLFIGGFSIVRAHNYWSFGWPVVITVIGWLLTFFGLFRLFFTELAMQGARDDTTVIISALAGAAVGVFLTCKGFSKGE